MPPATSTNQLCHGYRQTPVAGTGGSSAALDTITRIEILRLLEKLVRDRGLALVLVSHDLEIVRGAEGSDPSAVIFDGVERASARNIELVLADTAGRLHTKSNLMEELKKINWTGNIRELRNVIERLVIMADQRLIDGLEAVHDVTKPLLKGIAAGHTDNKLAEVQAEWP